MFNIWLGLYIIFALIAGIGGIMYFIKTSRNTSAIVYLIGAVSIFIVFGLKWFAGSGALFGQSSVKWPPYINTCPDYLTFYPVKNGTTTVNTCIDLIGVSKNGVLKKYPKGDTTLVPKTNPAFFVVLPSTDVSNPALLKRFCRLAIKNGLTWEGITNGESCIAASGQTMGIESDEADSSEQSCSQ